MGPDDRQFTRVISVVRRTLGDSILAVYRYGSAVGGGLRPASDLDVFVVTDRAMIDAERVALVSGLGELSGAGGAGGRPVEVTVAQLSSLVPWPTAPIREFQFGEWLRADFDSGFISPQTVDHDLAALVATILTTSEPVMGPQARHLLEPVPRKSLLSAMREGVAPLLDDLTNDTTNVLLTLARMLFTAEVGSIAAKDEAAQWVIDLGVPKVAPLAQAKEIYLHGDADVPPYDLVAVRALADELARRVRAFG